MSPRPPRHLADDDAPTPWWARLSRRRLGVAIGTTLLALPILVLDNLPTGPNSAEAVETANGVGSEATTTSTLAPHPTTTTIVVTSTTAVPTTTATTAPPRRTTTTQRPAPPTTTATTAAPHVQTLAPATTATTAPPPAGNTESGKATFYYWHPGECAHKTLPKGTLVTITNVATGASTTCTVTDRGPYGAGRIIDLDSTVFDDIAPLSQGVVSVVISW